MLQCVLLCVLLCMLLCIIPCVLLYGYKLHTEHTQVRTPSLWKHARNTPTRARRSVTEAYGRCVCKPGEHTKYTHTHRRFLQRRTSKLNRNFRIFELSKKSVNYPVRSIVVEFACELMWSCFSCGS